MWNEERPGGHDLRRVWTTPGRGGRHRRARHGGGYPPAGRGRARSPAQSWPPPPGPAHPGDCPRPPASRILAAPPPGGTHRLPAATRPGAPPGYGPYPPQPPARRAAAAARACSWSPSCVVAGARGRGRVRRAQRRRRRGRAGRARAHRHGPGGRLRRQPRRRRVGRRRVRRLHPRRGRARRPHRAGRRPAGRRVVTGTEPAVYGGSRDTQVCDAAGLVAFLTDPGNEAKAEAWADTLGVEVADIESLRRRPDRRAPALGHPGHQPRVQRRRGHPVPVAAPGGHGGAGRRHGRAAGQVQLRQPARRADAARRRQRVGRPRPRGRGREPRRRLGGPRSRPRPCPVEPGGRRSRDHPGRRRHRRPASTARSARTGPASPTPAPATSSSP